MKILIALGLFTFFGIRLNAQSQSIPALETIKLNPAVELDMIYSGSTKFTFSSINDYENGVTLSGTCNVKIKSTANWTFTVKANSTNFTKTASSNTNMPSSVLLLGTSLSALFQSISTSPISLATGTKGTNTKTGNFFSLNYKANPGYNYDGATYSLDLIYTITAQ